MSYYRAFESQDTRDPKKRAYAFFRLMLEIQHGYASSRESAQIDGDNALFKLRSLGAQ